MLVSGVFEVSSISYMYKLHETKRVKIVMMIFCSYQIFLFLLCKLPSQYFNYNLPVHNYIKDVN